MLGGETAILSVFSLSLLAKTHEDQLYSTRAVYMRQKAKFIYAKTVFLPDLGIFGLYDPFLRLLGRFGCCKLDKSEITYHL